MTATQSSAGRARIAEPGEGIGLDELALATRNHGMPLEALRYDVTPPGLHYVLTHYDIPAVDPGTWRLEVGGAVNHPLSLDLAELQARPAVTARVLLECAGNGRARLEPRPVSQPLVSSWKNSTMAYATQKDARVTSRVRSRTTSSSTANGTATRHSSV